MEQFAYNYGYFGVFTISLIGALSIVFPIPYTVVIYMVGSFLDPFLIAMSGGLGSAVGESIGYVLGYFGRIIISEERRKKIDYMLRIFDYYGPIAVFLFSLTPLPDDLLIIPLGIMRYNPIKFFIICVAGKTIMCLIVALGGRFSLSLIKSIFGSEGSLTTTLMAFLLLAIILALMLKIDWEKIFLKHLSKESRKTDK